VIRNAGTLPGILENPAYTTALCLVAAACLCVLAIGVLGGIVELRLHVNKTAIDSGYTGVSYLPLKLNPAGASPIMYAFALLALPQYVAQALVAFVPNTAEGAHRFLEAWGLSTPLGFGVYLALLFVLTIFFGLFTVGPGAAAKRMRDGGAYFDYIEPGEASARYLGVRVVALSAMSGVCLALFTGLPLWFIGQFPELQFVLMTPQTLMIVLGLVWLLREEIADTRMGMRYSFTLGIGRKEARA